MAGAKADTPISEQLGLDSAWRKAQMRLAGLDDLAPDALRPIRDFLGDGAQMGPVIAAFLDFLGRQPETAALLLSFDRQHLERAMANELGRWTDDFGGAAFFERHVDLVVVHVRLGVSFGLYLAALGCLRALLFEQLVLAAMSKEQRQDLVRLLARLSSLETLIAGEVYRRALARLDRRAHLGGVGLGRALDVDTVLERDALTGAVTRRVILDALDKALDTARKAGQGLTLMLLEIDDFEQLGEADGQAALRAVRAIIKASVREFDLVGRVGSRMFAVLLEGASLHTAHQVADRVRRHVAGAAPVGGKALSVSQGLVAAAARDDQQHMFDRCHQALTRARDNGGNCVVEASALAAGG